ncbi:hypothetical protein AbaMCR54_02170 [Acinetobacter baumannii]|uniref:hypothetical protein n=1 Tax=Acinetobacter baumannii TaxID=470 RepID=UPI000CE3A4B7|nr:hypothetical protein [Acinetobacter baumannii]EKV6300280.1 hypothetical protein [Acinetobacter baumannii]EKW9138974.1 hypothetical protein [Acinetobacter baumannii]PPC43034.1 hypothetical protein AbaMCR54_02170 [Acinetobacter baumannii]PPC50307.1 hypothetical protein AbaHEU2_19225 [Acinetobacter baumannii]
MKTIILKDITYGEEIIVKEIDDSTHTTGIDGYVSKTLRSKWVYADNGNDVDDVYHEYLSNAEIGNLIGSSHIVIKID